VSFELLTRIASPSNSSCYFRPTFSSPAFSGDFADRPTDRWPQDPI